MDNLSHSVVGLAAGEWIHRSLPSEPDAESGRVRRRMLLLSCWIASNFPDLDLFLTPLLPSPLGYLLHHRGHTHTVLYAIPQALLVWGMVWLCWPAARALLKASSSARTGLVLTVSAGFALHLLMDYLNSYGIHPFYPYEPRWFFGDMVFILEPLFWIAFGVPVVMTIERRWIKSLLMTLLVGAPLYFAIRGFLPWTSMATLAVVALVLASLQQRSGARGTRALTAAALVGICFVGIQGAASYRAKTMVAQALTDIDPASVLLDASMTPFPTNPVCWTFVSIESNEAAGTYRLRRGQLTLLPNIVSVAACPAALVEPPLATKQTAAITLLYEEQGALGTLRELKNNNCHFEAWLRFARAPSLQAPKASDLRFASVLRDNFSTINLEDFQDQACPGYVPAWGFPRADLLETTSNGTATKIAKAKSKPNTIARP